MELNRQESFIKHNFNKSWGVAQAVEHLPRKYKALSSNSSIIENNRVD
jgi:hypothetical protein